LRPGCPCSRKAFSGIRGAFSLREKFLERSFGKRHEERPKGPQERTKAAERKQQPRRLRKKLADENSSLRSSQMRLKSTRKAGKERGNALRQCSPTVAEKKNHLGLADRRSPHPLPAKTPASIGRASSAVAAELGGAPSPVEKVTTTKVARFRVAGPDHAVETAYAEKKRKRPRRRPRRIKVRGGGGLHGDAVTNRRT